MKTFGVSVWAVLIAAMFVIVGCDGKPAERTGKLRVVASFSVLADWTRQVAGDHIELDVLVGRDEDTHAFDPTPQDAMAVSKADLVLAISTENFETWLVGLINAANVQRKTLNVADGLKLIHAGHDHDHGHGHDHGHHHHGEYDPHVWHDVSLVTRVVETIRDRLIKLDPEHKSDYIANSNAYIKELNELDTWVKDQVQALPEANRKLITSHDTFAYFARRYGFEIVDSVLGSLSTDVADPSAARVLKLVQTIKSSGVKAIFGENLSRSPLMEQLANEATVTLVSTLYTDATGVSGSDGESYIKMVRYNVNTIVEALAP